MDNMQETSLQMTLTPGGMFDLEAASLNLHLLLTPARAFSLAVSILRTLEENTCFEDLNNG